MGQFYFASCVFSLFCCVRADIITVTLGDHGEISCSDKNVIDIINITVTEHATECHSNSCNVDAEDKKEMQRQCNGNSSCNIKSNLRTSCLKNYGYFHYNYTCEEILPFSCDFEQGMCGWKISQSDIPYQWIEGTSSTGPNTDHTTGSYHGTFMFTDASSGSDGNNTYFISKLIQPSRKQCLTFWYYITHNKVGALNVYRIADLEEDGNTNGVNIWSASKRTGNNWYNQVLHLPDFNHTYRIVFESVHGIRQDGVIAIDDIVIANQDCYVSGHDCNFEDGFCKWSINGSSNYHWKLHSKRTNTASTGPFYDHSTGLGNGTYIYLEANGIDEGTEADLISSAILQNHSSCLTFWYLMHGKHMGGLKVLIKHRDKPKLIWSIFGHRSNIWHPVVVNISISGTFTLIFRGIRGNGTRSDIAIDDIYLLPQTCSEFNGYVSHLTKTTNGSYSQTCLNVENKIEIQKCTKYSTQFDQSGLRFHPRYKTCFTVYQKAKYYANKTCSKSPTELCTLDFSNLLQTNPTCFMTNILAVEFTCKVLPVTRSKSQSQGGHDIAVAGGVLAGVILLACVVVGLIFMFRRSKEVKGPCKPLKKLRQNNPDLIVEYQNDYTGNQNIALPNSERRVVHNAAFNNNDLQYEQVMEGRQGETRTDEYEHPYTDIDNTTEEGEQTHSNYEYLDSEKIEDSMRNDPNGAMVEYYSCAKGNSQDTNNESHYSMAVDENSESNKFEDYAILDPNETGFNRSNVTTNASGRNDNKPTRHITNMNSEKEDQYDVSNNGTYDTSFNTRHKETDNNVYSHTVDSVYDTASHKRENKEKEDTYDHFVSQKSEDDNGVLTDL